ncbi:MAG: hypothetical protein ACRCX2_14880 [Paraclostridium sp.]
MAKLLGTIGVSGLSDSPRIINPVIDTQAIAKATSGNVLTDMAFETAKKYVGELEALERENEISEMQIQADNSLKEYESTWAGKDIYSDENYSTYMKGLKEVQAKNNELVRGKKFLSMDDVEDWKRNVKGTTEKLNYIQEGKKNQYQIQRSLDRASINITALQQKAILSDDEESYKVYMSSITKLMGTYRVSMSEEQVEQMKIKAIAQIDSERTKRQAEDIINGNGSDEQKLSQLNALDNTLMNDDFYKQEATQMSKNGYISKEYEDAYATQLKMSARDSMIGTNSLKNRLEEKIRNDKYKYDREQELFQEQMKNKYNSDKANAISYIKNGNDLKAIETLTGEVYSQSEILENETLLNEYYGGINSVSGDNYVAVSFSTTEINTLKNKNRVDSENGIPRADTVNGIMSMLNETEGLERENAKKQLIATGVISELEYNVFTGAIENGNNIANYSSIGKRRTNINKLGAFVGVKSNYISGDFMDKINNLTFEKREQVSEIIVGAIASGEFGVTFDPNKGISAVEFKNAYNLNSNFKSQIDYIVDVVSETPTRKYKENKMKIRNVDDYLDIKYGGKIKKVRVKTEEVGVQPVIREKYNFDDI